MKEANLLRHGRVEREDLAEGFDELKRRVRQAEVGPGQDREDAGVVIASKLSEKTNKLSFGAAFVAQRLRMRLRSKISRGNGFDSQQVRAFFFFPFSFHNK